MSTAVGLTLVGLLLACLFLMMLWVVMRAPPETMVVEEDEPDLLHPGHTHHVVHTVDVSPGLVAGTVMGAAVGAAVTEAIVENEIAAHQPVVYDPPAYNGADSYYDSGTPNNDSVSSDC